MSGYSRTAAILLAIALGALFPQAHAFSGAIRWLVMAMLYSVFLQVTLSRSSLHRSHLWLLVANLTMGFVGLGLGWSLGGRDVALATFFAGITPTATAAPVIMAFLRGRVDYVIASFLITNAVVAALIPVMLPLVLGRVDSDIFTRILGSVGLVVFCPMAGAWITRRAWPAAIKWPMRWPNAAFIAWMVTMFLITSNASDFIRSRMDTPHIVLLKVAVSTMLICATNFGLGWLIGGKKFRKEASQALGQKNTSFTIYLALTYASPLVALGPTLYVVWHNLWNSYQLHALSRASRKD